MKVLEMIQSRAAALPAIIALSEGHDPRVVAAGVEAVARGLGTIILIGDTDTVTRALSDQGAGPSEKLRVEDPATSSYRADVEAAFLQARSHKGATPEQAAKAAQDPQIFAAALVRLGHADGTVGGAVATTANVVRAALYMIGKSKDADLVSSFFLMALPENHPSGRRAMIFSDSGLAIDPSPAELASIAAQSAASCAALLDEVPKVAMLSFSTKGSARHERVSKVVEATAILQQARPDIASEGELQFDAAFVPSVGERKAAGSAVAGQANVMIFPNLDAGNIGYKIAQRVGGCSAIGPILQGLAKPANDLSRGCVVEDIVNMIAVTNLQVAQARS